jgi:hypothetical protein
VNADEPDVISFGHPRAGANRFAWAAIALLSAALAVAVILAVHYHGQVVALHRHGRHAARLAVSPATSPTPSPSSWLTVASTSAAFPPTGSLTGQVTFIIANPPGGMQTNIAIIGHLRGGRPHTRYTLTGGSCSAASRRYLWAAGVTDAHGNAELAGPVRRLYDGANYWLELNPAIGKFDPALTGDFAGASGISASRSSGRPMCI